MAYLLHEGRMTAERFFEFQVAHLMTAGIEVEESVEANTLCRGDKRANRGVGLQSATGAYTHDGETTEGVVFLTCGEVDIGEGIELVEHDIDIVTSYTCAHHGDTLVGITTGDGGELTVGYLALDGVEMGSYEAYSSWITHEDDLVGEMFGTEMKMEHTSVGVDDEFRLSEIILCFLHI